MVPGNKFQPVLDDTSNADKVQRIVLLTGKLYYQLAEERAKRSLQDRVALIRVEELSPFPFATLRDVLARYPKQAELVWAQEEPRNQGVWTHVEPRLRNVLGKSGRGEAKYLGRREAAVPAPGTGKVYKSEQAGVVNGVFEGL